VFLAILALRLIELRYMILVVGDINVDITAPLTAPLAEGEDCLSAELSFQCGGVGLNAAIALARLGCPARLVSAVGNDWFGDFALGHAAREGIDVSQVQRGSNAMTGLMFIAISPGGQRTFFGSRGACAELRATERLRSCLNGVTALEVAGYAFLTPSSSECADQLILEAKARGVWTAVDVGTGPSREIPEKIMQVVRQVDTVFANTTEAEALTAQSDAEGAFTALERAGAREVVLKLGGEGCLVRDAGELCRVPPFAVAVVDTTGAGDAFTAGFMAARQWGGSGRECALFANACGAAAITTMGAGERLPGIAEIEELLGSSRLTSDWDGVRREVIRRLRARVAEPATSRSGGA
jgi:sugar/nucleoside kinase (ribokinase family)